jgi:hypothetical protein
MAIFNSESTGYMCNSCWLDLSYKAALSMDYNIDELLMVNDCSKVNDL